MTPDTDGTLTALAVRITRATGFYLGTGASEMLAGGVAEFYDDLRWTGWESEVEQIDLDKGLSLWPPPFSAEGQDLSAVRRAVVPHAELVSFYEDMARQL